MVGRNEDDSAVKAPGVWGGEAAEGRGAAAVQRAAGRDAAVAHGAGELDNSDVFNL